jgi:tetratricopeptide (TPR) repeat protein
MVFDNVTDTEKLRPYTPSVGASQIIVTTTEATVFGPRLPLQVGVFTEVEAVAYLTERTGSDDINGAHAVAKELGFLPLALAQAGAVVRTQRLTYRVYLDRLRTYPTQKYLPRAKGDPYQHGVSEAILLSFDALKTADPSGNCSLLLDMLCLLSSAGISRELLYLLIKGGEGIDEELSHLEGASLVGFNEDASSVMIHPLVARVSRERVRYVGRLSGLVRLTCQFLRFCQRYIGGDPWSNPVATREIVRHVNALHDYLASPLLSWREPTELLRLRCWGLLCILELRDNPALAVELGEGLVGDCDRDLGESDRDRLSAWNNLASAYQYSGRLNEAARLLQDVLAKYENALGGAHPDTLKAMNNLALAYQQMGRLDKSIPLHEREVSEAKRQLGGNHPDTMTSESNLALAYRAAGRIDEAISLSEQVLIKREKILGTGHPDTLASRGNLATAYGYAGRREEALSLHKRVLDESDRILGGSHQDTLAACNSLACAYTEAGLWREAIPLFQRALSGLEAELGSQHPLTIIVRGNLDISRQRADQ